MDPSSDTLSGAKGAPSTVPAPGFPARAFPVLSFPVPAYPALSFPASPAPCFPASARQPPAPGAWARQPPAPGAWALQRPAGRAKTAAKRGAEESGANGRAKRKPAPATETAASAATAAEDPGNSHITALVTRVEAAIKRPSDDLAASGVRVALSLAVNAAKAAPQEANGLAQILGIVYSLVIKVVGRPRLLVAVLEYRPPCWEALWVLLLHESTAPGGVAACLGRFWKRWGASAELAAAERQLAVAPTRDLFIVAHCYFSRVQQAFERSHAPRPDALGALASELAETARVREVRRTVDETLRSEGAVHIMWMMFADRLAADQRAADQRAGDRRAADQRAADRRMAGGE